MFGIGTPELIVILVVALLVLGPKRLPEVARAFGKALADLRQATAGVTDELRNARILLEEEARATANQATGKTAVQAPPPHPPQQPQQQQPPPPQQPPDAGTSAVAEQPPAESKPAELPPTESAPPARSDHSG